MDGESCGSRGVIGSRCRPFGIWSAPNHRGDRQRCDNDLGRRRHLMPGARFRTQTCGRAAARTRLAQARKFLEVADLVATEREIDESTSVAAALAVLAGIAAADAA